MVVNYYIPYDDEDLYYGASSDVEVEGHEARHVLMCVDVCGFNM